jgi:urea carboxylase-associated protein 2
MPEDAKEYESMTEQTQAPALDPAGLLWQEFLPGGAHWSGVIRRGNTLRITDINGGANVSALLFNQEEKSERYNMADTLKAQHTAFLSKGFVCYSDMGRVLMSVTGDSCGWHDTICGLSNARMIHEKYGEGRYEELRNAYYRNGRDSLLIEMGKWGLGRRDLVSNLNLFSKVTVDGEGDLHFVEGNSKAGDFIDLRAEMNTLVVLSTAPHPLAPAGRYNPQPVQLAAYYSGEVAEDDLCRNFRPENVRGFYNTEMWFR